MTELLTPAAEAAPKAPDSSRVAGPDCRVTGNYLILAAAALADPMPAPGNRTTADYGAEIVAGLADPRTPETQRTHIVNRLRHTYQPATPETGLSGPINVTQAARNLVSLVAADTMREALTAGNGQLADDMAALACDLILADVLQRRPADSRGIKLPPVFNGTLLASLQRFAAGREEAAGGSGLTTRIREILSYALLADQLRLDERTADFLLTGYGHDPAMLKAAWATGFLAERPEDGVNDPVFKENLRRIVSVEVCSPGTTRWLYNKHGICCYARYSPALLIYLAQPKRRQDVVTLATAVYDAQYGSFTDPAGYDEFARQVVAAGYDLVCFEYANIGQRNEADARATKLGARHRARQEHTEPRHGRQAQIGPQGAPGAIYTAEEMKQNADGVRARHEGVLTLAWFGCSTGVKNGFTTELANILLKGVRVRGVSRQGSARFSFSPKDGVTMHEDPEGKPAPFGDTLDSIAYRAIRWGRRLRPFMTEHSETLDEHQRLLCAQLRNIQAMTSGF